MPLRQRHLSRLSSESSIAAGARNKLSAGRITHFPDRPDRTGPDNRLSSPRMHATCRHGVASKPCRVCLKSICAEFELDVTDDRLRLPGRSSGAAGDHQRSGKAMRNWRGSAPSRRGGKEGDDEKPVWVASLSPLHHSYSGSGNGSMVLPCLTWLRFKQAPQPLGMQMIIASNNHHVVLHKNHIGLTQVK